MGSRDRGEHIFNDDAEFREKMVSACQRLNLAAHVVKGSEDLIAKTLQAG